MESTTPSKIRRSRTAIRRVEYSRPMKMILSEGLLTQQNTLFDYGCGQGDDCARLVDDGYQASGWDPNHKPDAALQKADVVNLGFVINVIEDKKERVSVLRSAWGLTENVLVIAARMTFQKNEFVSEVRHKDGCVTTWDTFQKFYGQNELREWIDDSLGVQSVAAAPGVMLVFRSEGERQDYLTRRYGQRGIPRLRLCDVLFSEHQDLVRVISDFFERRGRLPVADEIDEAEEINSAFGSMRRAFQVIKRITGSDQWDLATQNHRDDLLVHFALERFGRRPKLGELNVPLQRDVRSIWGSYKTMCAEADELLFAAGDMSRVSKEMDSSLVGKVTQGALYVHTSVVPFMSPLLRVYEGCARRYFGLVDEANIIKLNRLRPKVSYLEYPDFDRVAHPTLVGGYVISLGSYGVKYFSNKKSENPPVLHRKETFVNTDYPKRELFEKLTKQEERRGLLDETATMGRLSGWTEILKNAGVEIRGHRVIKSTKQTEEGEIQ